MFWDGPAAGDKETVLSDVRWFCRGERMLYSDTVRERERESFIERFNAAAVRCGREQGICRKRNGQGRL